MLEVEIDGLPAALDGLRIAHLSDFHLGVPSRGRVATERAVAWVASGGPTSSASRATSSPIPVASRPSAAARARSSGPYVILGNHDVAITRDPFSRAAELDGIEEQARCSVTTSVAVEPTGTRSRSSGSMPRAIRRNGPRPAELADRAADLRILLCHFPEIDRTLPHGVFQLVLAGHLHAGQIAMPYPAGGSRSRIPRARFVDGLYPVAGGILHVSAGTGTTFVPFRFFARPEVTELVLRPPRPRVQQSS